MEQSLPPRSNHKKSRNWVAAAMPIVFLFGVGVAFTVGLIFGRQQGVRSVVPLGEGRVVNQAKIPETVAEDINFGLFWDVWNFAKESYYQQPVSDKALFYGSMKGLLAGLDDPYSTFFDPEEAKEFDSNLNGSFEGIGAQIDANELGQIVVVAPLPGTPAEIAGLLAGDKIIAIDNVETNEMSVEEAVSHIRGEKGTEVILTISRDGLSELLNVPITRDTITVDSVKWEMEDNGIAVINVYLFNEETTPLFTSAINEVLSKGAKGIVLDLRSNPGGLLDAAIDLASAWTGEQTVVYQNVRGAKQAFVGSAAARLDSLPTVVLVDGGSASASEIVSGALQDYGLGTLVGTKTFGKGSVQDYRELNDGSAVKLTTAEWLTPKERSINHVGITPDVVIEYTIEDAKAGKDPQFEKAIEILIKEIGN